MGLYFSIGRNSGALLEGGVLLEGGALFFDVVFILTKCYTIKIITLQQVHINATS